MTPFGYVYIWYDTVSKFFYVGSHKINKVKYICSSKVMLRAYKLRPHTFRMKILKYVYTDDYKVLAAEEQRFLDMIKPNELMISKNVKAGTCRYYNCKPTALGGSYKGHTKNIIKPKWNKGVTKEMLSLRKQGLLCLMCDKPKEKKKKTNTRKPTKNPRKLYRNIAYKMCLGCEKLFVICDTKSGHKRKYCTPSCASASPIFRKSISDKMQGKTAWNKGLSNPCSADHGRTGAAKQSATVTGRRKFIKNDGTWCWMYPNKSENLFCSQENSQNPDIIN